MITYSILFLSCDFALSQRLKIDFNIKRRLRFVLASCFLPFWRIVGDFTAFWLLSYIFILVMLYIVLYACVCALIAMCNFRGITVLALGQLEFFCPRFFIFCVFYVFCVFCSQKLFALKHCLTAYTVLSCDC